MHIAPPGDFIALGKQTKSQDSDSSKLAQLSQKKLGSGLDRKRDAPSAPIPGALVKRPKIVPQGQTFTPLGRTETERRASPAPTTLSQFEELAIEGLSFSCTCIECRHLMSLRKSYILKDFFLITFCICFLNVPY